ncbi:MAG: hypothetical protein L3J29_01785 [Cyclobacteriaceae bacterium]|nr:hypothetical protein [Cyclobacteriaceae bacterium]
MNRINYIFIFLIFTSSVACVTSLKSSKARSSSGYSEDLTSYLPADPIDSINEQEVLAEPTNIDTTLIITARLDTALQIVNAYNTNKTRYVEGLTIQLYSGSDRSKAKEVQLKAFRHFPDSKPKLIFDQPNYKVRMDHFYTPLEAYPVYKSVQSKFGKAILVPTRIPVSNK